MSSTEYRDVLIPGGPPPLAMLTAPTMLPQPPKKKKEKKTKKTPTKTKTKNALLILI